jgi:hypothetical protein
MESQTERFAQAIRDYVDERLRNKGPLYDAVGVEKKVLARLEDAFTNAVDESVGRLNDYRAALRDIGSTPLAGEVGYESPLSASDALYCVHTARRALAKHAEKL